MIHSSKLTYGMVLGERYRIEQKLGSGGMSHVYLAHDLKLPGRSWAIKESVSAPSQFTNVADEAQMLITLSHPSLPRIVDFFEPDDEGFTYLVMDYIEGITLDQQFKKYPELITASFIMRCADQLCEVLEYLHDREPPIVFRDMKPSNVMVTPMQDMRLIDFGIARNFKPQETEDTVKLGTVGFAAPEQYGGGQTDNRSDLYGLGALLLYLSTGGHYSEWMPGMEKFIRSDLPRGMIPVLRKMLQHRPVDRFQNATEARESLRRAVQENTSPMLYPNTLASSVNVQQATIVVAVIGTASGTGTTHTAIAMAHYLARQGGGVALAEMNGVPGTFARIQSVAGGSSHHLERKFQIQHVDYWRESARAEVVNLLGGSYRFLVLDLGCYKDNERLEEFLRADIPIVVGSGAEWRYQDILKFAEQLQRHPQSKWQYCLPLATLDVTQRISKELETQQVYALPWQPDPFDQHPQMDIALQSVFNSIIPAPTKRKKFRFSLR